MRPNATWRFNSSKVSLKSTTMLGQCTWNKVQFIKTCVRLLLLYCCCFSTHWPLGDVVVISKVQYSNTCYRLSSCEIALQLNATDHLWWWVSIGSGCGLVPSANKPLPEPMLTQIHVAIWQWGPTWHYNDYSLWPVIFMSFLIWLHNLMIGTALTWILPFSAR